MKCPNITPGKWIKSEKDRHGLWIETNEDEPEEICMVSAATVSYPEFRANIKAIAAVPELLAALETALSVIEADVLACERNPYPCAATQEAAIARKRARLTKAKDALTKAGYEFP